MESLHTFGCCASIVEEKRNSFTDAPTVHSSSCPQCAKGEADLADGEDASVASTGDDPFGQTPDRQEGVREAEIETQFLTRQPSEKSLDAEGDAQGTVADIAAPEATRLPFVPIAAVCGAVA